MNKLRFGIIGCSSVARRRFIPALLKSSVASLERIGSRSPEKAAQMGQLFNCHKTGSYDDIIEDKDVDAIYISIPVTLRDIWLRRAIKKKKHIIIEKPSFADLQDTKEILQLCYDAKVRIMECYMFRYHPQHDLVKKIMNSGRIGEPKIFTSEYCVPRPEGDNIRFKKELGGGVFLDTAGYMPATGYFLFGDYPTSVLCKKRIDETTGVDNIVVMLVQYSNGIFGHFTAAYDLQHRSKYSVHGTLGRVEVERAFAIDPERSSIVTLENTDINNNIKTIHVDPADQFLLMINDFASNLKNHNKSYETDLLHQQRFMEAARKSAKEYRMVYLKEV